MIKRKGATVADEEDRCSKIELGEDSSDEDSQELDDILRIWREPIPDDAIYIKDQRPREEFSLWRMFQRHTCPCMTIVVGIFLLYITHYNARQLQEIKENLGMTSKEHLPEMWWEKALLYKVIVRSFADTDNDGIGDFQGVLKHVDHLQYIGVEGIIFSTILSSPFKALGKDVVSFTKVDKSYGSLEDFLTIVKSFHEKQIKVLLEISLNQVSNQHEWFRLSREKSSNYSGFFVWDKGREMANKTRKVPNNWVSLHGGSAWAYDTQRDGYFYHFYKGHMPDLNFRSSFVWEEIKKVFEYWVALGVDGFILQDVDIMFEVEDVILDEPPANQEAGPVESDYFRLEHIYTVDHSDIHDHLILLRDWIDALSIKYKRKVALIVDPSHSSQNAAIQYYNSGPHTVVVPNLATVTPATLNGRDMYDLIDAYRSHVKPESSPLWLLSNTGTGRLSSKIDLLYQNVLNMLALLLPGATIAYQGDELAMPSLTLAEVKHLYRDPTLAEQAINMAPIPWTHFKNGGFTKSGIPWLPLVPDYQQYCVEYLQDSTHKTTPLHIFSKLGHLRREASFRNGDFQYGVLNHNIFSFLSTSRNNAPYLVAVNVGDKDSTDDYSLAAGVQYGKVIVYASAVGKPSSPGLREDATVQLNNVTLKPGEGVVLLLLLDVLMDL